MIARRHAHIIAWGLSTIQRYFYNDIFSHFSRCSLDFFVRQSADFFLKRRFDNRNEALQLTAWQRDFFKRNRADLWRLARAANDLDLPKFYNACCFQLAEEMRRHSAEEVAAMFEGSASLAKEAIPVSGSSSLPVFEAVLHLHAPNTFTDRDRVVVG